MTSVTTTTPPPSTVSSTTPKMSSYFAGRSLLKGGLNEVASTPPPTTPPPPPDPFDYEKTMFKDRLGDNDLSKLKEQVRILKGLPLTEDKGRRRKIDSAKPPKVPPKSTFTSCKRKELQQHRMLVRCANLKDKYREYELVKVEKENAAEIFRQLRSESMAKTIEQVDHEFDMEELENLKNLASKAKEQEVVSFRETHGSKLRYRFNRGQPIISENFRNSYDDFSKPPFTVCKDIFRPKIHQLPKIDKQRETWYVPVDDEEGIPLHRQMKSPDPEDTRSKRQRERPPVKKGKRTAPSESTTSKDDSKKPTKRPPWGSGLYRGCALNIV